MDPSLEYLLLRRGNVGIDPDGGARLRFAAGSKVNRKFPWCSILGFAGAAGLAWWYSVGGLVIFDLEIDNGGNIWASFWWRDWAVIYRGTADCGSVLTLEREQRGGWGAPIHVATLVLMGSMLLVKLNGIDGAVWNAWKGRWGWRIG